MSGKTINQPILGFVLVAVGLGIVYMATLQTIPNGSSHYFMIDVGETQIVLNEWGTLHMTGYPLYVIIGNLLTAVMRVFGVDPVVAPALTSMLWGYITLALLYTLIHHLTERVLLAVLTTLTFGLVRTVWIHFVIAEIYTFGTMIVMGLLCLALWRDDIKGRIYWMALLGGVGVAHHRAIAMLIPALLVAVWPHLTQDTRRLPRLLIGSLFLGLLGFTQYAYMYLRGRAGADWVYGDPGTLDGLWREFTGAEASRFIGPPDSFEGLMDNIQIVNEVLIRDLTLPGIILGLLGIAIAIWHSPYRRLGLTFGLVAVVSYGFHAALYTDVLSALILQVVIPLVIGWALLAAYIFRFGRERLNLPGVIATAAIAIMALFTLNIDFIRDVTEDRTGLETIEEVRAAPPDSTVMLAWGPRYFAVALAQVLQDDLQHITVVDDKVDYRPIVEQGKLITPEYTLFNQPAVWWSDRLGTDVYLRAAGPRLVEIGTEPLIDNLDAGGVQVIDEQLTCETDRVLLTVDWGTPNAPEQDLSVFVHALNGDSPAPIAQADVFAPVYGWRPLTTWLPGERVHDVYVLDMPPADIDRVRYGLYRVFDGVFENVLERELTVECDA